jgi:5-hydroxyisourate hydrolase
MSISAQAVDVVHGRPAAGVRVRFQRRTSDLGRELDDWLTVDQAETDHLGFVRARIGTRLGGGPFQIVFDSNAYFATLGLRTAYKEVSVVVRPAGEFDPCQIQLWLAPFHYSIYFGHRTEPFRS